VVECVGGGDAGAGRVADELVVGGPQTVLSKALFITKSHGRMVCQCLRRGSRSWRTGDNARKQPGEILPSEVITRARGTGTKPDQ
jgi:hypothetical protein